MLLKVVSAAIFAAVVGANASWAQSIAQIGDPAETPPASYSGGQYVDSRGCVFMRIVSNGQTAWYPRVNKARKVVCGMQPSLGAPVAVVAAPEEKPVVVVQAPVTKVAEVPVKAAAKPAPEVVRPTVVVAKPKRSVVPTVDTAGKRKIGCYTSAPVAELKRLRTGGTVVVCTRGDGGLTGWRPPIYPADAGVGAALSARPAVAAAPVVVAAPTVKPQLTDVTVVPKGYRLAWKDDRLNPKRGQGTPAGDAAQAAIWTQKTPAKLVADVSKAKAKPSAVSISSKSQASAGSYVQIGSFGVPSNASDAQARLQALGLPVAQSRLQRGGAVLQVVLAGPFGSAADAQAALGLVRQAGFGDAFIR